MSFLAAVALCIALSVKASHSASLNSATDELFELQMGEGASHNNHAHLSNNARLSSNQMNIPMDLDELRKMGIDVDRILDQLKQWVTVQQCENNRDEALLARQYLSNKTVTCNDGSQAG